MAHSPVKKNLQMTLPQFSEHFRKDFSAWMGEKRRLDDLLLIGIEV